MDNTVRNWYVFYTRPNSEKVVYNKLLKRTYDVFLPMVKTVNHWNNRQRKIVSKVLFPGYIFVKTIRAGIPGIEQLPGVVYCVRCGDRPAIVPDRDMMCIEQMVTLGQEVYTVRDFNMGEHVRVVSGPLTGFEGILVKRRGKSRFCIQLKDIEQCACIDIYSSMLEKV
jgi:transcription antitermination factor NusG